MIRVNGEDIAGGGASLPDTPDAVLADAASPDSVVMLDETGAGFAATPAQARAALDAAAYTYDLTGGALDYTADPDYSPAGATSTTRPTSGLLGDGKTVPRFVVFGRDYVAALARTTTPSLRATVTATNGEPLLQIGSLSESGLNLIIQLPTFANGCVITATVAVNFAGVALCTSGSDFAAGRFGVLRREPSGGIPSTVASVDLYTFAGELSGVMREGTSIDGNSGTSITITSETVGGVNARDIRLTLDGAGMKVETKPVGSGSYTTRGYYLNVRRRVALDAYALCLAVGQVKATPTAGYWVELRSLTVTPL